jgi:hypothetical protein
MVIGTGLFEIIFIYTLLQLKYRIFSTAITVFTQITVLTSEHFAMPFKFIVSRYYWQVNFDPKYGSLAQLKILTTANSVQ